MFYILILVTRVFKFVKTHQILYLKSVHFILGKLYLNKLFKK